MSGGLGTAVRASCAVALWFATWGCGDSGSDGETTGAGDSTQGQTSTAVDTSADDESGTSERPPMLDDPYGACAGSLALPECAALGPAVAECLERDGPGGAYSTCTTLCRDEDECPPAPAGNIVPACIGATDDSDGRCVLRCVVGVNTCPSGTVCIDGEVPACMWPQEPVGHDSPESFCDTACNVCGATLLLPWTRDCVTECLDDLMDCTPDERDAVFACTGGERCPPGGIGAAQCIESLPCIDGTPR